MSVSRPLLAALLLIAVAAIAGPVWAVFVYKPAPDVRAGMIPSPTTLVRFEKMAEAACRCRRAARGSGRKDSCWNGFDAAVEPFKPDYEVMSCGETGAASICFGSGDPRGKCFMIDTSDHGECNDEERRIIAAIWPDPGHYFDDPVKQARAEEADRRARAAFDQSDGVRRKAEANLGCGG